MRVPSGLLPALPLGLALLAAVAGRTSAEDAGPQAEYARGEALYETHQCEGCHEVAYVPGQIVYRLDGLTKRHTAESIAVYLASPKPPMPDFELSAEERDALALYLLATFP